MCFRKVETYDIIGISTVIVYHADMHVVAPVERVSAKIWVTEICFPRIIIAPVENFDVSMAAHVVIEANHLIITVAQIILVTCIRVKIVDPFDSNPDLHVDAHFRAPVVDALPTRGETLVDVG